MTEIPVMVTEISVMVTDFLVMTVFLVDLLPKNPHDYLKRVKF